MKPKILAYSFRIMEMEEENAFLALLCKFAAFASLVTMYDKLINECMRYMYSSISKTGRKLEDIFKT